MKKFFALLLTMCMLVVGTSMSAFAAEPEVSTNVTSTIDATSTSITPRNTDYWNTYGPLAIGNKSIRITPGAGKNLKIHLYMHSTNPITISVRPNGGTDRVVATWNTIGDHWADLVRGTNSGTYIVTLKGPTIADGGIYSEP